MKFTALELFIIQDTLFQSLKISNYSGRGTAEGRQRILEKICDLMEEMYVNVDVENEENQKWTTVVEN